MAPSTRKSQALQTLRTSRAAAFALGLTVLAAATGCHSWRPEAPFPQASSWSAVRLTVRDGSRITLREARFERDSITGFEDVVGTPVRRAVPVAQVLEAQVQRTDVAKTTVLVIGVGAVVGLLVGAAIAMSSYSGAATYGDPILGSGWF